MEIFNEDATDSALDTDIFDDVRVPNDFKIKYSEDVTKDGVYPISYRAYHTNYSSNAEEKRTAFTITIIDPCDEPISVTASTLANQEYTITQSNLDYQVPPYVASPTWCEITYSYSIMGPAGDAALTFNAST